MHSVEIILLILMLINLVLFKRWMDQVERGIVSFFKYEVTLFLILIMVLHMQWRSSFETVTMMCYGTLAALTLISIVNTKTNGSDISRDDLRIWSGHAVLLLFGTGALTLMIHVPDSIDEVVSLLGFISVVYYGMFLRKPR